MLCEGVNTDKIPGIFCLMPAFVRYEDIIENILEYTVLSLRGSRASEKLIAFPSLAYLIRSEAMISAKFPPLL